MSNAENLLDTLVDEPVTYTANSATEPHIIIGEDRYISVPDELKRIAVQNDNNIETVTFDCPRFWDDHDMSKMVVYIIYEREDKEIGSYIADNIRVSESDETIMQFDWCVNNHASAVAGKLTIQICVKRTEDDVEVTHWSSEINKDMYVSESLDCGEVVPSNIPTQIKHITIIEPDELTEELMTYTLKPDTGYNMSEAIIHVQYKAGGDESSEILNGILNDTLVNFSNAELRLLKAGLFMNSVSLRTLDLSACMMVYDSACNGCQYLYSVNLPVCVGIQPRAFMGCTMLIQLDLPTCGELYTDSFAYATRFNTLILRNTTKVKLAASIYTNYTAFEGTQITNDKGYIYVPAALIDEYKADTNWSVLANQFRAIEDYPDICG